MINQLLFGLMTMELCERLLSEQVYIKPLT